MNVDSIKCLTEGVERSLENATQPCLIRTLTVSSAMCWGAARDRVWCCRRDRIVTPGLVSAAFVRRRIEFMHSYCFPDWSKAKRRKMQHTHILKMVLLSSRNKLLHFPVFVRVLIFNIKVKFIAKIV